MKNFVLFIYILLSYSLVTAQPPVKKNNKVPVKALHFQTIQDSASYILGYDIGQNVLKRYSEINTGILNKGLEDALEGKKSVLEKSETAAIITNYMRLQQMKKAAISKKEGARFLAENGKRKGVITTTTGLQYEIIHQGKGPKPALTDMVKMNYKGSLINGTEFDASSRLGKPGEFSVGGVLVGWTEILQLMPVGSTYKVYLPADLAYGDFGAGEEVGPGETLIFEIELLEIIDPKNF